MSYEIKNINPKNLKKLYVVLNDIYSKFIMSEDFDDLEYGVPKGLLGVTPEEQKEIIAKLIGSYTLKGGYKDPDQVEEVYYEGGYILGIKQELVDLYVDVKQKIEEQEILSKKPTFDEENSILSFRKYKIQIAKQKEKGYAHELLKYIFNNDPSSPTDYRDANFHIQQITESREEKGIGKKFDNYCREINKKIKEQTEGKIIDFLIFSNKDNGNVEINPDYL